MPRKSPSQLYREQAHDSPHAAADRLLATYDLAIRAAIEGKSEGVIYCINLLRSALNVSLNPDLALSLQALYIDCELAARNRHFAHAAEILESMRGLWAARAKMEALQH